MSVAEPPVPAELEGLATLELPRATRRPHSMRRGWLVRRMLLAADLVGLTVAFVVTESLFGSVSPDAVAPHLALGLFLLTLPTWIVAAKLYGLYERDEERADHSTIDEFADIFHLVTVGTWILVAVIWLFGVATPQIGRFACFWALALASITLARIAARSWCRRQVTYLQNAIIVGAGDVGQSVAEKLLRHPEYGVNLVGFVDTDPPDIRRELDHVAVLGALDDLPGLIERHDVDRLVIAFSTDRHEKTLDLIRSLQHLPVQIAIVPRLFELIGPTAAIHTVEGVPMLGLPPLHLSRSSRLLKRSMDVVLASVALLLLAPLMLAIAWLIRRDSPGPALFTQVRIGAGGMPFRVYKFRTMYEDADARKHEYAHLNKHLDRDPRMFKIDDDPRVTRVGRHLRGYFLDELPQLLNVLAGTMSLIGPRPLIPQEARFVEAWGSRRLDLKPGMTGLWQVLGRSALPFEEMVKLDYLYVTTWSLGNDLRLLFRTLPLVARGESPV